MPSTEELRLEFCRIYAQQGFPEHDAIERTEALVQYIINGPKPTEKTPLKQAA